MKLATGGGGIALTVTAVDTGMEEPASFDAISETKYDPTLAKVWEGFCSDDVFEEPDEGSPKFQDHRVGLPDDVSRNSAELPENMGSFHEKPAMGTKGFGGIGLGRTTAATDTEPGMTQSLPWQSVLPFGEGSPVVFSDDDSG